MDALRFAGAVLVLFGIAFSAAAEQAEVRGTAFYRERIALPEGAVFEAQIEEIGRAGTAARVLGRVVLPDPGNPPFAFAIDYDSAAIDPRGTYAVRTQVTVGGELVFTSDAAHQVITGDAPDEVEVLMRMVAAPRAETPGAPAPPAPGDVDLPATLLGSLPCSDCEAMRYQVNLWPDGVFHLRRTRAGAETGEDMVGRWSVDPGRTTVVLRSGDEVWRFEVVAPGHLRLLGRDGAPIDPGPVYELTVAASFQPLEPRLTLRGMMAFEAGAPRFEECLTGRKYAITRDGDFESLEHAYLAGGEPAVPLMASFEGVIAEPSDGDAPEVTVERFLGVWPGETCEPAIAEATLINTYWKILRLGDVDLAVDEGQREPHLVLSSGTTRFSASVGCNQLIGTYELDGMRLSMGGAASTRMACPPELAARQAQLIATLDSVAGWRISGEVLELHDAAGGTIAMLRAVNLR